MPYFNIANTNTDLTLISLASLPPRGPPSRPPPRAGRSTWRPWAQGLESSFRKRLESSFRKRGGSAEVLGVLGLRGRFSGARSGKKGPSPGRFELSKGRFGVKVSNGSWI